MLFVFAGIGYLAWESLQSDEWLRAEAAKVACRHTACRSEYRRRHRDPFGWTYTFDVTRDVLERTEVSCSRAYFLVGGYSCRVVETRPRRE